MKGSYVLIQVLTANIPLFCTIVAMSLTKTIFAQIANRIYFDFKKEEKYTFCKIVLVELLIYILHRKKKKKISHHNNEAKL